jgi:hypothetical protein
MEKASVALAVQLLSLEEVERLVHSKLLLGAIAFVTNDLCHDGMCCCKLCKSEAT